MADFLTVLDEEIASLQSQLEGNPIYLKLAHLREVRALYGGGPAARANATFVAPRPAPRRASPQRAAMLERAAAFLDGRTAPTKTAEIYDFLMAEGFAIGGRDPRSNLSAMLSNSPLFHSHGRVGWTRAIEPQNEIAADDPHQGQPSAALFEPRLTNEGTQASGPALSPVEPGAGGGTC